MADQKISALNAKTTIHDTDLIPMVDIPAAPDETKYITGANLKKTIYSVTESELTIAGGVITVTQLRHTVDTQADDASDDLVTINGGATIPLIILRAENDARTVVVKHNTGNIWLKGKNDINLDDIEDALILAWDATNSKWFDVGAGGGVPDKIQDADGDTGFEAEQAADEDKIRGKVAGVEAFLLSDVGIQTLAKQSRGRAYRNGDWWISTGAWIRVPLNAETFDNQNEFNTTSKLGTATATTANHLIDTALNPFAAGDVGKWVYNSTDYTYAKITVYNSTSDVTLDTDIMANGEGYEVYASIFTAKEDGYYQVSAVIRCNWTLADKWYFAGLSKNGATAASGGWQSSVGDGIATNCISGAFPELIHLAANDYIELQIYHNEGDPAKFRGSTDQTYLAVHKIS